MTNPEKSLDEVLIQFHEAVEHVTPESVRAWTMAYPQYADEIRAHAVEKLDMEHCRRSAASNIETRDYSALVHAAAQRLAAVPGTAPVPDLRETLAAQNSDVRTFAAAIGIARAIVADITTGQILVDTIPRRFLRLAAELIGCDLAQFKAIVENSRAAPVAVAFKASGKPTAGRPRTWEEAVRASSMTEDRKAFWLADED
ncbi:hypothetical protein SAMN02799625_02587 [Methylobacterium sp. UNC300MFChir4.1]|uniref:hypothetical protein n=1 Tax=Methylobacterium sp. UNC300MFChir4.1 TaxID=1502747 RepID=UPI0008C400FC|nr:hypothetical protein [Methylobacterium sp. UNC300MFChir4.1]SEO15641.1 hypothetical protein SAMN02799625_02587 [Methylobacterium sp. UNC300MFChir4.1]